MSTLEKRRGNKAKPVCDEKADLEKRIATALNDSNDIELDDLERLIDETVTAIETLEEIAEREHQASLDIALRPDGQSARLAASDAAFALARLQRAMPDLQSRHAQIAAAENRQRWRAQRGPILAERDALAAEFRDYPETERKLVDLLTRMAANDAAIARLHDAAPDGVWDERLLGAELTARGLTAFSRDAPSITKAMRLPQFAADAHLAWPVGLPWNRGLL